jgi:hypothetical protein
VRTKRCTALLPGKQLQLPDLGVAAKGLGLSDCSSAQPARHASTEQTSQLPVSQGARKLMRNHMAKSTVACMLAEGSAPRVTWLLCAGVHWVYGARSVCTGTDHCMHSMWPEAGRVGEQSPALILGRHHWSQAGRHGRQGIDTIRCARAAWSHQHSRAREHLQSGCSAS